MYNLKDFNFDLYICPWVCTTQRRCREKETGSERPEENLVESDFIVLAAGHIWNGSTGLRVKWATDASRAA
jgi:hypothetical protein